METSLTNRKADNCESPVKRNVSQWSDVEKEEKEHEKRGGTERKKTCGSG